MITDASESCESRGRHTVSDPVPVGIVTQKSQKEPKNRNNQKSQNSSVKSSGQKKSLGHGPEGKSRSSKLNEWNTREESAEMAGAHAHQKSQTGTVKTTRQKKSLSSHGPEANPKSSKSSKNTVAVQPKGKTATISQQQTAGQRLGGDRCVVESGAHLGLALWTGALARSRGPGVYWVPACHPHPHSASGYPGGNSAKRAHSAALASDPHPLSSTLMSTSYIHNSGRVPEPNPVLDEGTVGICGTGNSWQQSDAEADTKTAERNSSGLRPRPADNNPKQSETCSKKLPWWRSGVRIKENSSAHQTATSKGLKLMIRGGGQEETEHCSLEDESAYQKMGADTMGWAMDAFYDENRQTVGQKQGLIFATGNIRRIKEPGVTLATAELQQHMWESMRWAKADVVGLADTGLDKAEGKAGQYNTHRSSGRAARVARLWGGDKVRWTAAQGLRGCRGATAEGKVEQGSVLAATEEIRMRCDAELTDARGWGRYGGFVIKGAKGASDVVVLEIMLAPDGSAMWKKQKELMEEARSKGHAGITANPREQAYTDIYNTLHSRVSKGAAVVLMGDFNDQPDKQHSGGALATMGGLMNVLELQDAAETRRLTKYKAMGVKEADCWTYETRGLGGRMVRSTPDHILVSKSISSSIIRVGILQHGPDAKINNTDHRFAFMEIELTAHLGWNITQEKLQKGNTRKKKPTLKLDCDQRIRDYHKEVELKWVEFDMEQHICNLEAAVQDREDRRVVWGQDEDHVQLEMDSTMERLNQVLKEAEASVVPAEGPRKAAQRRKKTAVTTEIKMKAQNVRRLKYLEALYENNDGKTAMGEGKRLEKAKGWGGLGTPTNHRQWQNNKEMWIHRVRTKMVAEMREMRRMQKKEYEKSKRSSQNWVAKKLADQRWGAIFKSTKGVGSAEIDRECLVVNEGTAKQPVMVAKTTKEEVDQAQDAYFAKWFGKGHETWHQKWDAQGKATYTHILFQDGEDGWLARKYLVEGDSNSAEYQKWRQEIEEDVPEECRWVLNLYRRKYLDELHRCIEPEDYTKRGLMETINTDTWEAFWEGVGANKASDSNDLHVNLLLALRNDRVYDNKEYKGSSPCHILEGVRRLLNIVVKTGMIYSDWQHEIICTLPKVEGSTALEDIRPIGLVPLLRNILMGIQNLIVLKVWELTGVIESTAYGGIKGGGTDQPRIIQQCVYEYGFIHVMNLFDTNFDKARAFDTPSQSAGYQLGLMRLAIPDKFLKLDLKLGVKSVTHIRNAYGYTTGFKRGGEGATGRATTQGARDSATKYVAFKDPFDTFWVKQLGGVKVRVSELDQRTVPGFSFMDDERPFTESLEEVNLWLRRNAQFGKFHGCRARPDKCEAHAQVWTEERNGKYRLKTKEEIGKIIMQVNDDEEGIELPMKEADECKKTLGGLSCPGLYFTDAAQEIKCLAIKQQKALQNCYPENVNWKMMEACYHASLVYKLKYTTINEEEIYDALLPAWMQYKLAMKLPRSSPTALAHSQGFGDMWAALEVERIVVLLRMLNGDDDMVRSLLEGSLMNYQQHCGNSAPVLSSGQKKSKKYSGMWIERLHHWMSEHELTIEGGEGMRKRYENDGCIVDEAEESEKEAVATAAGILYAWRWSDLITREGERRRDGIHGGKWHKKLNKSGLNNGQIATWFAVVERGVKKWKNKHSSMGGRLRDAVAADTVITWQDSAGKWRVGKVSHAVHPSRTKEKQANKDWWDDVWVEEWEAVELHDAKAGSASETKWAWPTNLHARITPMWKELEQPQQQRMCRVPCSSSLSLSVCDLTPANVKHNIWAIEDDSSTLWERIQQYEEVGVENMPEEMIGANAAKTKLEFNDEQELIGFWAGPGTVLKMEDLNAQFDSIMLEAEEMRNRGETVELLTYSDASLKGKGSETKATQGWIIAGLRGGKRRRGIKGGSVIHGNPEELTSTRAETFGLLSLLLALRSLVKGHQLRQGLRATGIWDDLHTHKLDNQAVVQIDEGTMKQGEKEYITAAQWMSMADPDVWANVKAVKADSSPHASVEWQRGHPERRKKDRRTWTFDEEMIYEADLIADLQYGRTSIKKEDYKMPVQAKYQILYRGRRVLNDHRKRLRRIARAMQLKKYMVQHISRKQTKQWRKQQEEAGINLQWGEQATYNKKVIEEIDTEVEAWAVDRVMQSTVGTAKAGSMPDISKARFMVKLFAEGLCTREEGWRLMEDEGIQGCRLGCKHADGSPIRETNEHILWECCGCKKVVDCRKSMVISIKQEVEQEDSMPKDKDLLRVATAMWMLGREGACIKIRDKQVRQAVTETRTELQQPLEEAVNALRQQGTKWARVGLLGKEIVNLWCQCGMTKEGAERSAVKVSRKIVEGLRQVWITAAGVLRESDEKHRSRISKPRETMWADIEEVLMAQAQAGVENWEETETKLLRTTNKLRQIWTKVYKEARANGMRVTEAAKKADKIWTDNERNKRKKASSNTPLDNSNKKQSTITKWLVGQTVEDHSTVSESEGEPMEDDAGATAGTQTHYAAAGQANAEDPTWRARRALDENRSKDIGRINKDNARETAQDYSKKNTEKEKSNNGLKKVSNATVTAEKDHNSSSDEQITRTRGSKPAQRIDSTDDEADPRPWEAEQVDDARTDNRAAEDGGSDNGSAYAEARKKGSDHAGEHHGAGSLHGAEEGTAQHRSESSGCSLGMDSRPETQWPHSCRDIQEGAGAVRGSGAILGGRGAAAGRLERHQGRRDHTGIHHSSAENQQGRESAATAHRSHEQVLGRGRVVQRQRGGRSSSDGEHSDDQGSAGCDERSSGWCVAGSEGALQRGGREGSVLAVCRVADDAGAHTRGGRLGTERGEVVGDSSGPGAAVRVETSHTETVTHSTKLGAKKTSQSRNSRSSSRPHVVCTVSTSPVRSEGSALRTNGQNRVGILSARQRVGAEHSVRHTNRQSRTAVGQGAAGSIQAAGSRDQDQDSSGVVLTGVQDIFESRLSESGEGLWVQGSHPRAQATTAGTRDQVWDDGKEGRHTGAESTASNQGMVPDGSRAGLGHREPSRIAGEARVHGGRLAPIQEVGSHPLLCIPACIPQAHPHLDKYIQMETTRRDRNRQVRVQMQCWKVGSRRQVDTQVQDSQGELSRNSRPRTKGNEEHGAPEAAARNLECLEGVNDESQRQENNTEAILYREGGYEPD